MIFILVHLGLMCFDNVHRDYYDLRCNINLEPGYIISYKSCNSKYHNTHLISQSDIKNNRVIDCKKKKEND